MYWRTVRNIIEQSRRTRKRLKLFPSLFGKSAENSTNCVQSAIRAAFCTDITDIYRFSGNAWHIKWSPWGRLKWRLPWWSEVQTLNASQCTSGKHNSIKLTGQAPDKSRTTVAKKSLIDSIDLHKSNILKTRIRVGVTNCTGGESRNPEKPWDDGDLHAMIESKGNCHTFSMWKLR